MRVTFYELTATSLEKTLPKILEKVYESGMRAVVKTTPERLSKLDSAMWTYAALGFLPHGSANDPEELRDHQPIWLTSGSDNPIGATVMVVTDQTHANPDSFERILDVYDGNDENATTLANERIAKYKERGLEVDAWKQTLEGAWEKA